MTIRPNPLVSRPRRIGIAAGSGTDGIKVALLQELAAAGYQVVDFASRFSADGHGANHFVMPLAHALALGEIDRGIALDEIGIGPCLGANRVPGVRACLIQEASSVQRGVEDDDLNLICIGTRTTGHALAWMLTEAFLNARFGGGEPATRPQAAARPQPATLPAQAARPVQATRTQAAVSPEPALELQPITHPQAEFELQPLARPQPTARPQLPPAKPVRAMDVPELVGAGRGLEDRVAVERAAVARTVPDRAALVARALERVAPERAAQVALVAQAQAPRVMQARAIGGTR